MFPRFTFRALAQFQVLNMRTTFASRTCTLLVLTTCLLFPQLSLGQQQGQAKEVMTLAECLSLASSRNFDVLGAEEQLRSASASVTAAFGNYLPGANFNFGYSRRLNIPEGQEARVVAGQVLGFPANSYNMSATANYTLFDGFNRESQYTQAEKNLEVVNKNIVQTRRRVLADVRTQFLSVQRAKQILSARREDLELAQKELERIKATVEAGRLPIANQYTQEAEVGNRELAVAQAENDVNQAKNALVVTLGLNPGIAVEFVDSSVKNQVDAGDVTEFRNKLGSMSQLLARALANRADISAADARVESARAQIQGARSGYLPQISASGGWSWQNFEFSNFSDNARTFLGLNLQLPLFDRFQTNNQIQVAAVQTRQREIERQQLEQQISGAIQSAMLTLLTSEKQLDITARSLKAAEQNFSVAEERFRVGAGTILDYTTANNQLINARINRINAVTAYLSAQFQVQFAVGELD